MFKALLGYELICSKETKSKAMLNDTHRFKIWLWQF